MTSTLEDHPDKYNDPRVRLTRRGLLFALVVVLFGVVGTAVSIWARRTRLEKSTEFWGEDTIRAFQLAEEVTLIVPDDSVSQPAEPVRLSGMPGLGHLRHVLLDERSYDWETLMEQSMGDRPEVADDVTLQFSDPSAKRFPDASVVVDLDTGWVGAEGGTHRVRLNERFRVAMPTFLKRVANYEPLRAEMRAQKARASEQD